MFLLMEDTALNISATVVDSTLFIYHATELHEWRTIPSWIPSSENTLEPEHCAGAGTLNLVQPMSEEAFEL